MKKSNRIVRTNGRELEYKSTEDSTVYLRWLSGKNVLAEEVKSNRREHILARGPAYG